MFKEQRDKRTVSAGATMRGGVGLVGGGASDPRLANTYPTTLNAYILPPPYELTLMEFETFALDRLSVLRAFEAARIRSKNEAEISKYIDPILTANLELLRNSVARVAGTTVLYEQRRKDHISHFILRLAYCKTEELRTWFCRQETALFKHRFGVEEGAERERFLAANPHLGGAKAIPFRAWMDEVVDKGEQDPSECVADFRAIYGLDLDTLTKSTFYLVPFEQVTELVAKRAVYLHQGQAFVPESERLVLVANAFREHLMRALETTAKALPRMDEDDRLAPVLNSIAKQYLAKEYNSTSGVDGEITADKVHGLAAHFPPCMRNLHAALARDHHLKHGGRLQFGLFLKGIGLSLEEALIFWRKAFNRMNDDEFNKKGYIYNIRYNYGLEGKRANYTPYSCMKIITSMGPGSGDNHGCPFKHFSHENLRELMHKSGASEASITDVMRIVREGHYQIACTKLYEATHGKVHADANLKEQNSSGGVKKEDRLIIDTIEHPNQWFDLSYRGLSRASQMATD